MYTKDKSHRITLRVNDEQFSFVKESSDLLGVSPSDFLRMVVNMTMASSKVGVESAASIDNELIEGVVKEGFCRENEKTDFDN